MSDNIFSCLYAIFTYTDCITVISGLSPELPRGDVEAVWYKGEIGKPWDGTSLFAILFGAHRLSALAGDRPESFVSEMCSIYINVCTFTILDQVLERDDNEQVKVQLNILLGHKEDDAEDFSQRTENIRVEFDDQEDCYHHITNSIANTQTENYFLSILQHLMFVREDPFVR